MAEIPEDLRRQKHAVEQDLLARPGVVGVGIGYKEVGGEVTDTLAIRVFVEEKRDVPEEELIPTEVEAFPTDVVERNYEPHALHISEDDLPPPETLEAEADGKRYDPLVGGISIGPQRLVRGLSVVGTLGAIVKDNDSGGPLLLSCFHVLSVDRSGEQGDAIVQPGRPDGGVAERFVAGSLERMSLGDQVDCAVASPTRAVSGEIVDIGDVSGTKTPAIDQQVRKQGRSTGLTFGTVDTLELTIQIRYGGGIGLVELVDQININPDTERNENFGEPGDSGATVVTEDNKIIGLYVAGDPRNGNALATPISAVFSALKVDSLSGQVPAPEEPAPPNCPPQGGPCAPCLPPPCVPPGPPPPCLPPPCVPCIPPPPCLPPPCLPCIPPPPCVPCIPPPPCLPPPPCPPCVPR